MSYTLTEISVPEFDFDFENNMASATRTLRMEPWSELDTVIADLSGGAISFGQLIVVSQPIKYPGKDYLWLLSVKAKPFFDCVGDVDANSIPEDPKGAELTLTYKTPRFEQNQPNLPPVQDGTFLTVERNMSLEFVSEKGRQLYWEQGKAGGDPFKYGDVYEGHALPIDVSVSSYIAIGDIRVTWHRVSNPPWSTIFALQGTVNNDTFMGFSAEQVLFVGVSDQRQFNTNGSDIWKLTYQFSIRIPKFYHHDVDPSSQREFFGTIEYTKWLPAGVVMGGWNHFPRKGATGRADSVPADTVLEDSPYWQKVYRRAGEEGNEQTDNDLLYIPTDFRKLFEAEPSPYSL